jgi:hypothetical protein
VLEIDHELSEAAIRHFLAEFFQARAIRECSLPFDSHPDGAVANADEDGRSSGHVKLSSFSQIWLMQI